MENSLTAKKPEEFKLGMYYYVIELTAFSILLIGGLLTYLFQDYVPWIKYPVLNLWLFVGMFLFNLLFFILHEIYKKKFLFDFTRYAFIVFFLSLIYISGGVESNLIILLVYPLLVSAVDLDPRWTKKVAISLSTIFALMIFANPEYLTDPVIIIKHIMHVLIYIGLSVYTYNMVKNTFNQKFEKEEAKRKLFELVEIDKMKTDFVTIASHQLRTPLSSASWGLDNVLSDNTIPEKDRSIIKESYERIKKANQIVSEMLQAVDISKEGYKLNEEKIDLVKLVQDVMSELHYLTINKNVVMGLSSAEPVTVDADSKLLKASLMNVFDNAVRYSPNGKVDISVSVKENYAEIMVKDNGVGIESGDLPYIFEKFFRGKNALSIDPNETGVGLYVTKKIITLHGGTITLSSKLKEGTMITINLPIRQRN
ncbi:MAG: HAMP domain-containing sensor histidine kinase [Candidatus Paceibacterota bacterium]